MGEGEEREDLRQCRSASRSSILDDDYRYIESTLSQNPSWITPLAGLIRSGSLNGLLRESFDDPRAAAGERWKGKCTKFSQLPFDMVVHMLRQTGVQLSDDVVRSEDFVRQLFMAQFWLADTVCLPKTSPDIRFVSSLGKIAKMRLDHLGRNWLAAHARAGPITEGKKETFRLWEIKNDELVCRAFTLDNDGRVASASAQSSCTSVPLPVLQSDEWRLSDPYAPNCRVYAARAKASNLISRRSPSSTCFSRLMPGGSMISRPSRMRSTPTTPRRTRARRARSLQGLRCSSLCKLRSLGSAN